MNRLVIGLLPLSGLLAIYQVKAEAIPDEIRGYVSSNLPEYEFFTGRLKLWSRDTYEAEKPWSIKLDVNGDNQTDWVGFLAKDLEPGSPLAKSFIQDLDLYCVCSTSDGFTHFLLLDSVAAVAKDDSVSVGIYERQPGLYESKVDGQENRLISNPSVEYTNFEKSSRIFFWNGNAFEQFWTSD